MRATSRQPSAAKVSRTVFSTFFSSIGVSGAGHSKRTRGVSDCFSSKP